MAIDGGRGLGHDPVHAFRPETVADDGRPAGPHRLIRWPGSAGAGRGHRSVCLSRALSCGRVPGNDRTAPLVGAAAAILLRAWLDHHRTMIAHRTAARVQERLRGRLFDKIVALGPAWFGAERTGGVMLSMVDGVEQLQSFFGQYLPQVTIAVCAPVAIFVFIAWWDVPVAARHAGGGAVHADPAGHCAPEDGKGVPRAAIGVQVVRRGIPRRGAGAADAEGVRPELGIRADAGGEGAGACRTARSGCWR